MTNYDLFTAGGYALLGTHGIYDTIAELSEQEYTLDRFVKKRYYKVK
jgi:urocanate hydratase